MGLATKELSTVRARLLWLTVAFGLLVMACGGATTDIRVSSPFTAEHELVFENGIDFVSDPRTLEGPWMAAWQRELDERVGAADVIARVTVEQLRSAWDLDRHSYHLELSVVEVLRGAGDQITVTSIEGQPGFSSVVSSESRLLHGAYLLFVKWVQQEGGGIAARWHLSPDTELVVSTVRARVATLTGATAPSR